MLQPKLDLRDCLDQFRPADLLYKIALNPAGYLPPTGIYGGNGLPRAISGVNSFWERGYGNPPPETLIVVGFSANFVQENFATCELVAHTWNRYGVQNEETRDYPDIYVCRGLRRAWPEFWKDFQHYS